MQIFGIPLLLAGAAIARPPEHEHTAGRFERCGFTGAAGFNSGLRRFPGARTCIESGPADHIKPHAMESKMEPHSSAHANSCASEVRVATCEPAPAKRSDKKVRFSLREHTISASAVVAPGLVEAFAEFDSSARQFIRQARMASRRLMSRYRWCFCRTLASLIEMNYGHYARGDGIYNMPAVVASTEDYIEESRACISSALKQFCRRFEHFCRELIEHGIIYDFVPFERLECRDDAHLNWAQFSAFVKMARRIIRANLGYFVEVFSKDNIELSRTDVADIPAAVIIVNYLQRVQDLIAIHLDLCTGIDEHIRRMGREAAHRIDDIYCEAYGAQECCNKKYLIYDTVPEDSSDPNNNRKKVQDIREATMTEERYIREYVDICVSKYFRDKYKTIERRIQRLHRMTNKSSSKIVKLQGRREAILEAPRASTETHSE
ncbi:hypothetical protein PAPHI01_1478 [Pancytospora philotis]|nr:hypothetical protein PAPHI01_1478 [Pancytospora philotis]